MTAFMDAFGFQLIASVAAVPVAVVVTTVAQVAEDIAPVARADVPLAMVMVQVGQDTAGMVVLALTTIGVDPVTPVTVPDPPPPGLTT